jgi:hypothetical protein
LKLAKRVVFRLAARRVAEEIYIHHGLKVADEFIIFFETGELPGFSILAVHCDGG